MPGVPVSQRLGYLNPGDTPRSRPAGGGGMPDLSLSTPFQSVMPPAGAIPSSQPRNENFSQGQREGRPGRLRPNTGEEGAEGAEDAGKLAEAAGIEAAGGGPEDPLADIGAVAALLK